MAHSLPEGTFNIDVLFGNDYYDEIMKTEKINIDNGLYLVNSTLGWMFSGRIMNNSNEEIEMAMLIDEELTSVNRFWDLETIGINTTTKVVEDEKLISEFGSKLVRNNNRYQVSWPWKLSK